MEKNSDDFTTEPFELTLFSSTDPPHQSKTLFLDGSGKLSKVFNDPMREGNAVKHRFNNLQQLADLQNQIKDNQFLVYGVIVGAKEKEEVPIGVKPKARDSPEIAARSKEYIDYPQGKSVFMIDIDAKDGESADEKKEKLYEILPELQDADRIERPSCSSYVSNGETEEILTSVSGWHIYFVTESKHIEEIAKLMDQRLWLKGQGKIVLNANGRKRPVTLFDNLIYQPTREDFVAKANVVAPLVQKAIESKVIRSSKRYLAFEDFQKLSDKAVKTVNNLIDLAEDEVEPESKARREAYKQKKLDECHEWSKKKAEKERLEKVLESNTLPNDWIIWVYVNGFRPEPVSVDEILANPDKYEGLRTSDPEDHTYRGGAVAGIINVKRDRPNVYSFHSGIPLWLGDDETSKTFIEWGDPVELVETEGEHSVFPVNSLPSIIRAAVVEVADNYQVSPALAAMSALSTASLSCQCLANVSRPTVPKPSPISLYLLVKAESGERKSTVDGLMNQPFYDFVYEKTRDYDVDLRDYQTRYKLWEVEFEASKSNYNSALKPKKSSSASSDVDIELFKREYEEVLKREPKEPKKYQLLTSDFSSESLIKLLYLNKNIGMITAEGGRFFNCYACKKEQIGKTTSDLNEYWSGSPVVTSRKTVEGFSLDGSDRLMICIMAQPAVVDKFVHDNDVSVNESGFLARFLIAAPPSMQGKRIVNEIKAKSSEKLTHFQEIVKQLIQWTDELINSGKAPKVLKFSSEAAKVWLDFYNLVESKLTSDYSIIKAFASKAAEQSARIASIFHFFSNEGPFEKMPDEISADNVRRANELIIWFLNETLIMLGKQSMSWRYKLASRGLDKLVEYCIRNDTDSMPISKFSSAMKVEKQEYNKVLDTLESQECVRVEHASKGKAINIFVNPKLIKDRKNDCKSAILPKVTIVNSTSTVLQPVTSEEEKTDFVTLQNSSTVVEETTDSKEEEVSENDWVNKLNEAYLKNIN